jgi:hypothetical protein
MIRKHDPVEKAKGPGIWVLVAGFAAAALLTLGAAVGTSMLQQQSPEKAAKSFEAPVAQR